MIGFHQLLEKQTESPDLLNIKKKANVFFLPKIDKNAQFKQKVMDLTISSIFFSCQALA